MHAARTAVAAKSINAIIYNASGTEASGRRVDVGPSLVYRFYLYERGQSSAYALAWGPGPYAVSDCVRYAQILPVAVVTPAVTKLN